MWPERGRLHTVPGRRSLVQVPPARRRKGLGTPRPERAARRVTDAARLATSSVPRGPGPVCSQRHETGVPA
jgi:hypothetical protein